MSEIDRLRREVRATRALLIVAFLAIVGIAWQRADGPRIRELVIVDAEGEPLITLGEREGRGLIRLADGKHVAEITARDMAITDGRGSSLIEPRRLGILDGRHGISLKTPADGESSSTLTIAAGERQTSVAAGRLDVIGPTASSVVSDDRVAVTSDEGVAILLVKPTGGAIATKGKSGRQTFHSPGH